MEELYSLRSQNQFYDRTALGTFMGPKYTLDIYMDMDLGATAGEMVDALHCGEVHGYNGLWGPYGTCL